MQRIRQHVDSAWTGTHEEELPTRIGTCGKTGGAQNDCRVEGCSAALTDGTRGGEEVGARDRAGALPAAVNPGRRDGLPVVENLGRRCLEALPAADESGLRKWPSKAEMWSDARAGVLGLGRETGL